MKKIILSLLVLSAVVCGCNNDKETLCSKKWVLEKVVVEGRTLNLPKEKPEIIFSDTLTINGKGGCNLFFGRYELKGGNEILVQPQGMTRRMCPDEDFEIKYMQVLRNVKSFEIKKDSLILQGVAKETRLSYAGK